MKIFGAEYLDSNDYKDILISNNIVISANEPYEAVHFSSSFTDPLKGKSDEDIIEEVIKYYLDYHTVTSISLIDSDFFKVDSTSHVSLRVFRPVSLDIRKRIFNKYEQDRMSFLNDVDFNSSVFKISSSFNCSSYDSSNGQYNFNVLTSLSSGVYDYESVFLTTLFDSMMFPGEIGVKREKYLFPHDMKSSVSFYDTLACNNASSSEQVYVSNELVPIIFDVVSKHNNLEREKPKQLVLEGFK